MVGRNGVPKNAEAAGGVHGRDRRRLKGKVFEEGRFLDIGAFTIPRVSLAWFARDFVPSRILLGKVTIQFLENLRLQRGFHREANLVSAGPQVF